MRGQRAVVALIASGLLMIGATAQRGASSVNANNWSTKIVGPADLDGSSHYHIPDCTKALVSNGSAAANMVVVLCRPAVAGMEVLVVVEDATKDVDIEPANTESISSPEVTGTGDGLHIECNPTPCTVGTEVHLISQNSGNWRVVGTKGSVATDNNSGADLAD